ncbi:FAD-dependent oxidoreductase [Phototrophicus methaneseepsis]|uniref:FAD-dependent oxidoreductase n=1 Tax=Phototrophicus methaneseepsis TaxID=2710758 RepID=A0A7S8E6S2_9CHLR|nr:NAD(P)/FAD-dependent oxidoreductase [Phototrophicus methaneseepsis]QPC81400.1 FAD-dependent oxidoreductase [Phototrophicus methaneseepsis]
MPDPSPHILIIGAGIGGLTTAALLAKAGYKVTVFEAQTYPGGSASTFTHKGYRFDAGATVAGGFQQNGPHDLVGRQLGIEWPVHQHDPAWIVHLPGHTVPMCQDNEAVRTAFPASKPFWQQQQRVADLAWKMAAQGLPWPPQSIAEWIQLAQVGLSNFPADLRLAPYALQTVSQWLKRLHLHQDAAFVRFLDASLLISAQTTTPYANALYGATALDLTRQGVYHVEGGIGALAKTLADTIQALGGEVHYRMVVTRIATENGRVTGVYAKRGRRTQQETFYPADFVIANTTPWSLDDLLQDASPTPLKREVQQRQATNGAFVLHLGVRQAALPPDLADHHQIVRHLSGPMGEGETLFLSMSPIWDTSRAPSGMRAVTVSTHTHIQRWWDLLAQDEAAYQDAKEAFADEILGHIDAVIPGFKQAAELVLPGTPITYAYYTLRQGGMVGGFPQVSLFKARGPRTGIPNLRLVGDSIFPGQSTAGVTLSGMRVAADVQRQFKHS